MNETYETKEASIAGAGQKLFAHSKAADFTAKRGLVVELFPFIFGAGSRMSAKAISEFFEREQQIKLSSVTINRALRDPAKHWNLFFDMVEPAARIFAKDSGVTLKDLLFCKQYFFKPVKHPILKAAVRALVKEEVAHAASILRTKWFVIDWEIRLKAEPFLQHRLEAKGKAK